MTQKHFIFLAKFFAFELALAKADDSANGAVREQVTAGLARLLATRLAHTNPKFDRKRFLTAVHPDLAAQ